MQEGLKDKLAAMVLKHVMTSAKPIALPKKLPYELKFKNKTVKEGSISANKLYRRGAAALKKVGKPGFEKAADDQHSLFHKIHNKDKVRMKEDTVNESWSAVEHAYGSYEITHHKSKSDAMFHLNGKYGSSGMKSKKKDDHYEVGGNHIVTKTKHLPSMGYHSDKAPVREDAAPANCVGGGKVAGAGVGASGEPGVSKKKKTSVIINTMLRRKMKRD